MANQLEDEYYKKQSLQMRDGANYASGQNGPKEFHAQRIQDVDEGSSCCGCLGQENENEASASSACQRENEQAKFFRHRWSVA